MDLRVVDHPHHQQQPPFSLVSQHHPMPATSIACPASSEPSNGPLVGKSLRSPSWFDLMRPSLHTLGVMRYLILPLQAVRTSTCNRNWWFWSTSRSSSGSYWLLSFIGNTSSCHDNMKPNSRNTLRWVDVREPWKQGEVGFLPRIQPRHHCSQHLVKGKRKQMYVYVLVGTQL